MKTFALALLAARIALPAFADMYKWIDENGKVHYTDSPPPGKKAKKLDLKINSISGPPVVLKVPRGTHGVGVMLAETAESVDSILETLWGLGQNILVQEFIAEARGRDMRVLVVGDEVVAAMRRHAAGTEFRANVHRGGAGRLAKPTPMARRLAIEATRVLGLAVAGVDLVETAKGPLVLEVNASPGFEELERATKADVAGKIIEYASSIARRLRAAG